MSSSLSTLWDWKVEPESPSFLDSEASDDVWLFDDNDAKQFAVAGGEDDEKLGLPTTRAELASELLDDLDEWIKKEPFNDWLEEKIDLPMFEELPPLDQKNKYKSLDTQTLLQEFETVFGEVEYNNGALTPPQSPPIIPSYPETEVPVFHQMSVPVKKMYYPVDNGAELMLLHPVDVSGKVDFSVGSGGELILLPPPNCAAKGFGVVHEQPELVSETTTALDELVRARAADIDMWETPCSVPDESSGSEYVLSPPESGSENSNCESGSCEDPEWIPDHTSVKAASAPRRKRAKPYSRPVEDKKLRKKEQNKNAATRYRQKKKAEVDVILGEEKLLQDTNAELHQKVSDVAREIKYLKGLMRDLFKAKGLLK